MESHHSHHITHKKKWTEYLLEFFMLFFAVFLGFIAENIRENIVEKEKGHQYLASFYRDLKKDTATFSRITAADEKKELALKDIYQCYDTVKQNWKNTSCLVPLIKNSRSNLNVSFSTGTLQQLKNAGGYRLLKDDDRDSIVSYDNSIQEYLNFESTAFQEAQDIVRNDLSTIMDFSANRFIYKTQSGADSSSIETPILFSDDRVQLNKYFNDLFKYRVANTGQITQIKIRKDKAVRLINYFKNKYHFE